MKRSLAALILMSLFIILISEVSLVILHGVIPQEPDPPQFKYKYVDIYKKMFRKFSRENGYFYTPQRLHCNAASFKADKETDTIRIFIIGGSVAEDFNHNILKKVFEEVIPAKRFEVINCGMPAYDSYRVSIVAREILSYMPDLVIVISGSNEIYNKVRVNLYSYYVNKFLRKSWTFRKLQDYFFQWCAEREFMYFRGREKKLLEYERNTRLIVKKAKAKKVPIILCTLPVNFSDCPPPGGRPINKQYLRAIFLLESGDYLAAIEELNSFLKHNNDSPFGFYFLGCAYEKINNHSKAKEYYLKALELCYGNGRASPKSNEVIRRISIKEEVGLADLESAFIDAAPFGLVGREIFSDFCHWYPEGDFLVAEVILQSIVQNNILNLNADDLNKFKLEKLSISGNILSLKERGRIKSQVQEAVLEAVWEVLKLEEGLSERAISNFETIYFMNPDSLLEIMFTKDKIKRQYTEDIWFSQINIPDFDEQWHRILYHIGETCRRLGMYGNSLEYFDQAAALNAQERWPYIGRALTYYSLGDVQKAREHINESEKVLGSPEVSYYKEILQI